MKRAFAIILLLLLTACGGPKGEDIELIVFAAASLQESLTEIGGNYEKEHPGVTLVFNFDSSGALKAQIREGADCDVFISAGQKQMDQLDASAGPAVNTGGLDFIPEGARFDLLENKVALAVPEGNPKGIEGFDQLAGLLETGDVFLAMVLPPTVAGYLLLLALGPRRVIGSWFLGVFGLRLTMTWWSAVFATVVVSFPLMYRDMLPL